MNTHDPQFVFVALVLPSLFALTFIADGVFKLMRSEPAWVPLVTGAVFIGVIVIAYFYFLS